MIRRLIRRLYRRQFRIPVLPMWRAPLIVRCAAAGRWITTNPGSALQ